MLNVLLLGVTSLLTDFSSEMVLPILPAFIQSVGGGAIAIGLVFGIGDAVASLLRVFSGYWADRTRRYRAFTFFGYLASAVAKFGYVGALRWPDIAFIRPVERLGKGFRDAPRDAIVSESVPQSRRGMAFGIQRAMDSAGAIIGSVAVLVFYVWLGLPFRTIFLISAFVGLAAVLPVLLVRVPESLARLRHVVRLSAIPPSARKFILIAALFGLGNFSIALFIFAAQQSFGGVGIKEAITFTLIAYVIFNIADAVTSAPAGILSDRIGRRRILLAGYGMFAVVCLGFMLTAIRGSAGPVTIIALFVGYGLFKALIDASQRAMISDLSPDEVRGTAIGAFETAVGLAAIPSGLMAGWLYSREPALAFGWGAGIALLACILLAVAIRRR